ELLDLDSLRAMHVALAPIVVNAIFRDRVPPSQEVMDLMIPGIRARASAGVPLNVSVRGTEVVLEELWRAVVDAGNRIGIPASALVEHVALFLQWLGAALAMSATIY